MRIFLVFVANADAVAKTTAHLLEIPAGIFSQEPSNEVTEYNGFVGFVVIGRTGDASEIPEISLPFIEFVILAARVKEDNIGIPLNEPATEENLDTTVPHCGKSSHHDGIPGWLNGFDFHWCGLVGQRAHEAVSVPILFYGDRDLGFDNCVDPSNLQKPTSFGKVNASTRTYGQTAAKSTEYARIIMIRNRGQIVWDRRSALGD